ncbi:histidine protein methyltransferase 1 homolog [Argonauta hians]
MSFCFNFPDPEANVDRQSGKTDIVSKENEPTDGKDEGIPTLEMKIDWKLTEPCKTDNTIVYEMNESLQLVSVNPKHIENILKDYSEMTPLTEALCHQTDLIPNKYEGGLQIWECCLDLCKYLAPKSVSGLTVAELGCGAGLPGLCALKKGASAVLLQDFNSEVLSKLTLPNILLNCFEKRQQCHLFHGDWGSLPQAVHHSTVSPHKFDIIVTAETIYNTSNYQKLIDVFDALLTDNGYIVIAAKAYYFGVGGGTRQFEESLLQDGRFSSTVSWTTSDGLSREIICVRRKQPTDTNKCE